MDEESSDFKWYCLMVVGVAIASAVASFGSGYQSDVDRRLERLELQLLEEVESSVPEVTK